MHHEVGPHWPDLSDPFVAAAVDGVDYPLGDHHPQVLRASDLAPRDQDLGATRLDAVYERLGCLLCYDYPSAQPQDEAAAERSCFEDTIAVWECEGCGRRVAY